MMSRFFPPVLIGRLSRRSLVGVVLAGLALVVLPAVVWAGASRSSARFGDAVGLGVARVSVGTVDVDVGTRSIPLNTTALAPGDSAIGGVAVTNAGTLPIRYRLSAAVTSDDDNDAIAIHFWTLDGVREVSTCEDPNRRPADGGTRVDSGAGGTAPALLESTIRSLPRLEPGAIDVVCYAASVSIEVGNDMKNDEINFDLIVDAIQDVTATIRSESQDTE